MANEAQVLEITELRLGLPGRCREVRAKKHAISGIDDEEELVHGGMKSDGGSCYVKVGFDGVPFLRKLNLSAYEGYAHLEGAIKGLFEHLQIDRREYIHAYEDREGDWMLVGDVPWEMFVQSCKKLRVMKGSEANAFKTHARSVRNHVQE